MYLIFSYRVDKSTYNLNSIYCGYIYYTDAHYTDCTEQKQIMCEETASKVQVESVLNDLLEGGK